MPAARIRPHQQRASLAAIAASEPAADPLGDEALDALVRAEVEAAFAGLEASLASGDEAAALAIIQTQGKEVLGNVLQKLENDGQLLSATISDRIEALAGDQSTELLKRYDEKLSGIQASMNSERVNIRTEIEQLEQLNREYQDLQVRGTTTEPSSQPPCIDIRRRVLAARGRRCSAT